jgi:hypothetical protein
VRRVLVLLVGDHDLSREHRRLASLLCLVAALAIASTTFVLPRWWEDVIVTFRPTLASGLIALCLVAPLYLRGILRWERSVYGVAILVLNLAVTAALARAILGEQAGLLAFDAPMTVALWAAIALGWLGMRPVAALAWIAVFALGSVNLLQASEAMGFWGFAFVAASFLGVLLQSDQDPRTLVEELKLEFSGEHREARERIGAPSDGAGRLPPPSPDARVPPG